LASGSPGRRNEDSASGANTGLTRVFILAETTQQAQGLMDLLADEDRFEVIGWETPEASNVDLNPGSTYGHSAELGADVVLLAGNVSLAELPFSGVPVVVLSSDGAEDRLGSWDHRGPVRALLTTETSPEEILAAVLSVAQGLTVLTLAQAEMVFESPSVGPGVQAAASGGAPLVEKLTPRELQVLRMVAEGLGNKEIAGQLGISDHTAKFHVASILAKLHAQTRTEAAALGIRLGLVPI
jgi:DNA-binding NarL/FixJ family response regulator